MPDYWNHLVSFYSMQITGPHYRVRLKNLLVLLSSPGGPNGISNLGVPALEESFLERLLHLGNILMMIQKAPDSISQKRVDFLFILLIFTKNQVPATKSYLFYCKPSICLNNHRPSFQFIVVPVFENRGWCSHTEVYFSKSHRIQWLFLILTEGKPCVSLNISCLDYTHWYVKIFTEPKNGIQCNNVKSTILVEFRQISTNH